MWVYANIFDSEKAVDKNGARATSDHVEGCWEIINSSDFVIYFPYDSTEMEVGRKHIHVLTDSYEIWQRHSCLRYRKARDHVLKRQK